MMMNDAIDNQYDGKLRLGYRTAHPDPLSTATTTGSTIIPMYNSDFINPDLLKAESDLTYSLPASRKRSRDYYYSTCTFSGEPNVNWNSIIDGTFLGEDVASQIQQQQFEIDQFVARHTEKVRSEIIERRRRNSIKLISALEESIAQRLRAKEDEIMKMTKLNCALEDKLKSLCIENQIWRELAQTNELTANALRNNLKQVLEQVVNGGYRNRNGDGNMTAGEDAVADDAQSCCESNNNENERMLAEQDNGNSNMKRLCKSCGEMESNVLLLPCRHLCLCTACVSSVDICPICKSAKNISVHVHLS